MTTRETRGRDGRYFDCRTTRPLWRGAADNVAVVFYFLNGYRFEYDSEVRAILKGFGTDEAAVDEEDTTDYLRSHTEAFDLAGEIEAWRDELVRYGLSELTDDSSDPND